MINGIIYIRVSSSEQIKGTSLIEQEAACRRYCEGKGINVLEVFSDEGASAKSIDRPRFLEAIEFCRKKKVGVFVVWKCDRFARNQEDHIMVQAKLLSYGTSLHSVTEPISDGPTGKMLGGILAAVSEFDNSLRAMRCSGGMLGRLKQGIYPWKPPQGYLCEHNKKQDKKKERPDPKDPKTFSIIQRGLQELASGKHNSQTDFASALKRYGLVSPTGNKIDLKYVHVMLTKHLHFYAGILDNTFYTDDGEHGEKTYEGEHEPMITMEELYSIQAFKAGKKLKIAKYGRHGDLFPLKSTVYCSECSHKLTASRSRGRGGNYFPYYQCYNTACLLKGKGLIKKNVEAGFVEFLKTITPSKKFLDLYKTMVIKHWTEKGQIFSARAKELETEIADTGKRRKNIYDMRESGEYTREQFRERIDEIDNKIMTLNISLSEARIEQFDIEAAVSYATQFITKLDRVWFDMSPKLKPRFQKLVLPDGVLVSREYKFRTTKLGLIYEVNAQHGSKKSYVVDSRRFELLTFRLQSDCSTN